MRRTEGTRVAPYSSAEDSLLLLRLLPDHVEGISLEVGVGRGVVMERLLEVSLHAVGTDISVKAIMETRRRLRQRRDRRDYDLLVCCGADAFRDGIFEFIASNPPYLPSESISDEAVDGGNEGAEVILRILRSSLPRLKRNGRMAIVHSSLTGMDRITELLREGGFRVERVGKEELFFEELYGLEIEKDS